MWNLLYWASTTHLTARSNSCCADDGHASNLDAGGPTKRFRVTS